MVWLRLDDGFSQHPKVIGLSDAAFRLHVTGLTYAARHLTDGVIPTAALPTLYPNATTGLLDELLTAGLWHAAPHTCEQCPTVESDAVVVHDFLAFNPSAAEAREKAQARSDKARRAATARWARPAQTMPVAMPARMPVASDRAYGEQMLGDAPTRPDPTHPHHATACAILDLIAQSKTERSAAQSPTKYRAKVRRNLDAQYGRALAIAERHAGAPIESLAAAVLGEPAGGLIPPCKEPD